MMREHSTFIQRSTFNRAAGGRRAFTLIELLVVIAIIAILAGLLLPAAIGVKNRTTLNRVQGELAQVANAIETYKIDKGFYPPDNRLANGAVQPYPNSLYYELTGANFDRAANQFTCLGDNQVVAGLDLNAVFGVAGINNAGIAGNTEGLVAKNYLPEIKPTQYLKVPGLRPSLVPPGLNVLGTIVDGPFMYSGAGSIQINPFRYVSSNPTNNASTFDLWVDVIVAGKTNRVSNWSDKTQVVSN